jgi:hypothetical protein
MKGHMTPSSEELQIKRLIARFKKLYPKAQTKGKDKNLVGNFLERLVAWAFIHMGLLDYDGAVKQGERGIDIKVMDDSFSEPLLIAVECMNGTRDYTEKYFGYFKARLAIASQEHHVPLIICVDKKTNFQRFKGNFSFPVYFVELGKQYHPSKTRYKDYLALKSKLKDRINDIAQAERPDDIAEREFQVKERMILTEDELKAYEEWIMEDTLRYLS